MITVIPDELYFLNKQMTKQEIEIKDLNPLNK